MVADGAEWIWNRARQLAGALGLSPADVVQVADFYHATEHLSAIADLRPRWTQRQRRGRVTKMSKWLKRGKLDAVVREARTLPVGGQARDPATQIAYFEERRELMRYDHFIATGVPIGSGAMESAVRRVVNLRLEGPGIFCSERTAEVMVHLRSYLKAGRWDELMQRVVHRTPDGSPACLEAVAA